MKTEIKRFDPQSANNKDWKKYHSFRLKKHQELYPKEPFLPDEMIEKSLKTPDPMMEKRLFVIFETEKLDSVIGQINLFFYKEGTPSYENHKDNLIGFLTLLKSHRKKGLEKKLLRFVIKVAKDYGKPLLLSEVEEEEDKQVFETLGLLPKAVGVTWRYSFETINWNLIKDWIDKGSKNSPELRLIFSTSVPEEIIERFSNLYTEIMNQIPRGELVIEKRTIVPEIVREMEKQLQSIGIKYLIAILLDSNNHPCGLTEIIINPKENWIEQRLMGIHESRRGKGLGKWLIGAALTKLRKDFPSMKGTTNYIYKSNAPMTKIARQIGADVYRETMVIRTSIKQLEECLVKTKDL